MSTLPPPDYGRMRMPPDRFADAVLEFLRSCVAGRPTPSHPDTDIQALVHRCQSVREQAQPSTLYRYTRRGPGHIFKLAREYLEDMKQLAVDLQDTAAHKLTGEAYKRLLRLKRLPFDAVPYVATFLHRWQGSAYGDASYMGSPLSAYPDTLNELLDPVFIRQRLQDGWPVLPVRTARELASMLRRFPQRYDPTGQGIEYVDLPLAMLVDELGWRFAELAAGAVFDRMDHFTVPKRPKGTRPIDAPRAACMIVEKTLKHQLTPLLERGLSAGVVGFRQGHSVPRTLALAIGMSVRRRWFHWLVADIRDAYGTVKKRQLRNVVKRLIPADEVVDIVMDAVMHPRRRGSEAKGIPQGSPLSPALLNAYLNHYMDRHWPKWSEHVLFRYVDDLLVVAPGRAELVAHDAWLRYTLGTIGMELHPRGSRKWKAVDIREEPLKYLGLEIHANDPDPRKWVRLADDALDNWYAGVQEKRVKRGQCWTEEDAIISIRGFCTAHAPGIPEEQISDVAVQLSDMTIVDLMPFPQHAAALDCLKEERQNWLNLLEAVLPKEATP